MGRFQQLGMACLLALCGISRTADAGGCPIPGFGDAAFGKNSVTFTGNGCTDSWNSSLGTYSTTACSGASCNGSVGTDSTASGAITLTGNACVQGACDEGYGGLASSISGGSSCNSTGVESSTVTLSSVTAPALANASPFNISSKATLSPNMTYGSVSESGKNTLTLGVVGAASTYVMSSLSLSGQSTIVIPSGAGQVTVFITGSGGLSLSGGGVVNNTGKPTNLIFMCTDSVTSVSVTGNGTADFAIYAPNADISITGNGDVYGALVGKSIKDSGNGTVHYDQALGSLTSSAIACTATEVSRASPVVATVTDNAGTERDAIVQGSYEMPLLTQATINVVTDVVNFSFPSSQGHLRARTSVKTSSTFSSTTNGETLVFDAASNLPAMTSAACGTFGAHGPTNATGTCRNVWTNTTTGALPTTYQLNDTSSPTIGALIAPTTAVSGIGASYWQTIVRDVLAGQSGKPMLGGVDRSTVAVIGTSNYAGGARPTMAYFGATDGMLHAVCASDVGACAGKVGTELWAFMPRVQLPLVRTNTTRIDGSPRVADVFDDFSSALGQATGTRSFQTVLAFQTGSGTATTSGQTPAVYALIVTDPANPVLLWEYTTPTTSPGNYELGSGLTVDIGAVKIGAAITNLVFVETNNGGTAGAGAVVTALYAGGSLAGTRAWQFGYTYPSARKTSDGAVPATGIPGGAAAVDLVGKGFVTDLVFGDLYGNLWDIDPATGLDRCASSKPLFSFSGTNDSPFGTAPAIYSNGNVQYAVLASGGYADLSDTTWGTSNTSYLVSMKVDTTACSASGWTAYNQNTVGSSGFALSLASGNEAYAQARIVGSQIFLTTDTADVNSKSYTSATGKAYQVSIASPTSLVAITGSNTVGGAGSLAATMASGVATLYGQQQQLTTTPAIGTGVSLIGSAAASVARLLWVVTM